jgi:hypothetical protein
MSLLDGPVQSALRAFADDALDGSWSGQREREAVSLFAFGALLNQIDPAGPLQNSRQIGLEVPVPQVTLEDENSQGKKNQVCKDVVIWPEPRMTCWDTDGNPTRAPAAVIEWKFDRASIYQYDVDWLTAFTNEYSTCAGYAVTANPAGSRFTLSCTRVVDGQAQPKWIHIQ